MESTKTAQKKVLKNASATAEKVYYLENDHWSKNLLIIEIPDTLERF